VSKRQQIRIHNNGRWVNSIFCLFFLGSRFLFSLEYPGPVFTCAFLPACHCTVKRICLPLQMYTYGAAFPLHLWHDFYRSSCPHPASFHYLTGSGSGIVSSFNRTACLLRLLSHSFPVGGEFLLAFRVFQDPVFLLPSNGPFNNRC
jgi:hypothetical protein